MRVLSNIQRVNGTVVASTSGQARPRIRRGNGVSVEIPEVRHVVKLFTVFEHCCNCLFEMELLFKACVLLQCNAERKRDRGFIKESRYSNHPPKHS